MLVLFIIFGMKWCENSKNFILISLLKNIKFGCHYHYPGLRVQADQAVLPGILHDQGSAEKKTYIVNDFEPSLTKEFSGAMRFSAVFLKIEKKNF